MERYRVGVRGWVAGWVGGVEIKFIPKHKYNNFVSRFSTDSVAEWLDRRLQRQLALDRRMFETSLWSFFFLFFFLFCIFVSILFGTFHIVTFKLGLDPVYSFKLQFEISSVRHFGSKMAFT
jgi:fatty-acid desaturase